MDRSRNLGRGLCPVSKEEMFIEHIPRTVRSRKLLLFGGCML